tara:strand:+ start:163 stop:342 length:180 start_codon:yes stop_codon:yes gene_type:complete
MVVLMPLKLSAGGYAVGALATRALIRLFRFLLNLILVLVITVFVILVILVVGARLLLGG